MSNRKFWKGDQIIALKPNEIFVFGSNPEGRHGKGAAKQALKFGAIYGNGRGLQGQTYALITKNLKPNFIEPIVNYIYPQAGPRSLTLPQIQFNVLELYQLARQRSDLSFLVVYKNDVVKSLCGYSPRQIVVECFLPSAVPTNIIFHESFIEDFSQCQAI